MTDLTKLTLADARDALKAKTISAHELTDAHISAMEKARALNAYVLDTADQARAMAKASDEKLAKGAGGPLEGIPLGIKDLYATKGVRTTACSKILGNFVPEYESTVTSQLWRDGAVIWADCFLSTSAPCRAPREPAAYRRNRRGRCRLRAQPA